MASLLYILFNLCLINCVKSLNANAVVTLMNLKMKTSTSSINHSNLIILPPLYSGKFNPSKKPLYKYPSKHPMKKSPTSKPAKNYPSKKPLGLIHSPTTKPNNKNPQTTSKPLPIVVHPSVRPYTNTDKNTCIQVSIKKANIQISKQRANTQKSKQKACDPLPSPYISWKLIFDYSKSC